MTEPAPQAQPDASPPTPIAAITRKVALHGSFATQKTLQIAHLIDRFGADSVVVISGEKGLGTIESKMATVPAANIIPVATFDEFRAAIKTVVDHHNTPDKWVCIDGATRILKWEINRYITEVDRIHDIVARGETVHKDDVIYKRFISKEKNIDTVKIYGHFGIICERLWSMIVNMGCNFYVNFLSDETKNDDRTKKPPFGPDVPGNMGLKAVMSSFDFTLALYYDAAHQLIARTQPSGMYLARTREDRAAGIVIPEEIVGFDLAEFVDLINGGRK
jgi:hypothetical protein